MRDRPIRPGRGTVAVLGGAAATFAFAVGAVSLTRIAGDYFGFPPSLEWTLTAAVDVAGIAGGVMWTGFIGRVRKIGRLMNIVCTVVSGIGVGLDHATHAPPQWRWVAFAIGMFIPLLVAWILHALAVMADEAETSAHEGGREVVTETVTRRETAPRPPDREAETVAVEVGSSLVATTGTPDREATARLADTDPLPRLSGPRAPWMSERLIKDVVASAERAAADGKQYGEGSIFEEKHLLPDGQEINRYKSRTLIKYLRDHGLVQGAA